MNSVTTMAGGGEVTPELWQAFADNLPQLAWVARADGHIFWYNRRWFEYTGTTLEQMEGWGWKAVHHPLEVEGVEARFRRSLESGEPFEDIFPLRGRDGCYRDFLTRAQPLRDAQGRVIYWFGTNTDVTEQRSAERRSSFLLRLEEALRGCGSADEGVRTAAELLAGELRASRVLYADVAHQRQRAAVREEWLAPGVPSIAGDYRIADPVFAGYAKGEPLIVEDFATDPRMQLPREDPAIASIGLAAFIDVPLRRGGEVVAILTVHDIAPRAWTPDEIALALATAERTLDTVQRSRAEEALRASETQFRTVAEALPGMLFVSDADGHNLYVNRNFRTYLGLDDDSAAPNWFEHVHEEDRAAVVKAIADADRGRGFFRTSYRFRRHDGMYRWQSVQAAPLKQADGTLTGWVGVALDVHDARLAEAEIREAEERYAAVFNSAAVGIGRVAADGGFLEINERYCTILGRTRDEIMAGGWREITHPDDVGGHVALVERALRGEIDSYSLEKRYLAKDGSDIWVHLTVSAERDADGSVKFFIPVVEDIGDRKRAEAALRDSEERYRTLFESMEQGFCIIQVSFDEAERPVDYRFTEINPAFTKQAGLSEDALDRSVREAVPGLEQAWFDRYGEIARTGVPQRFVDWAQPLRRWFEVYAFPIGRPEDSNVAILFDDITERRAQEEALRDSEQQLRLRLNAIPQMVWSTRPDGFHDFFNDRWYEFTGLPLGAIQGDGWSGMFHPDDQPRAWQRFRKCLETGEPYEVEYRLRHHTGNYRWVLGRALPIRGEAGEIVRWMGTCTDIDDRMEADRALRESEARLRAVIEAAPIGLVFADASGTITGGNELVSELIGQEVVESARVADYKHDYVAFHADGRQVEGEEYPLARALAGEELPELECKVRRGDGTLKWLRYVAAAVRAPDGAVTGGVVASIDIDREKHLTESLEREVERVIAEREAAQEALRQSQKLEAMGQLTGGVAHDFNNLLTPIIGSLDLLQRKQILDDRTGRLVEGALASAEKARMLVQRLLAFARRQPLQPRAVDLRAIVLEMSELIASTSGPRVRVEVDAPAGLPLALADGNQLEMALLNLAVNARDAMPDGGMLTIQLREEGTKAGAKLGLKAAPHLVLSVSDTGVGMDEETRRRAIEPFFSTKGIGKGTGLGLSMVHGLAAQLGGALDVRSAPGVGTTIELWLPVASGVPAAAEPGGREQERQGAGLVLLVDDEELVRASTANMLHDLGYEVVEAESGEEALARVAEGLLPDILVTDHLMPGCSGTDLAHRLRETRPDLPVLIVSGYADIDSLSTSFPHLSKPYRQGELGAALEKLARRGNSNR